MSDTLSLSNVLSRSSLLDKIANPVSSNPLAIQSNAAQAAEQVWRVRQQQANQASGEAYQGAIDAQGNFDPAKFNQNLMAAGPGAALAAQSGVESAQKLRGSQIEQSAALRDQIGKEVSGLLDVPDEQLGAGINAAASRLKARGVPENVIHQYLLDMPTDPAGRRATLEQLRRSLMPSDQLQTTLYGTTGTETGQDGRRIGTVQQPAAKGGAVTAVPGQGVALGVSPESDNEVVTITNPDGSQTTDTKGGQKKAGRLTPTGDLAPGFTQATASPGMVSALRGQEATPDGRTSVAGARGQMQVTPGFFKQYAQPGESFDSKRDVEEVAQRGIAALEAKYPNDPARVAAAYFSGAGNVAPPGSPTPYKQDLKDANGTPTSAYVAGVMGRYKPDQTGGTGPKPGGTSVPAGTVEANAAGNKLYTEANAAIPDQQKRLIAGESALEAMKLAATGPSTGWVANAKAWLEARGEDTSGTQGLSEAAARQVLQKQLLRFADNSAKGAGTDLRLETQMHSNANPDMLASANRHVLLQDIGILRRDMAMNKMMPRNAAALDHVKNFPTDTDPRAFAFDVMTPEERGHVMADIEAADKKADETGKTTPNKDKFRKSLQLGRDNGVVH